MDFTWYYFIGRTKLGLSYKEVGRITLTLFNKLYQYYKDNFDLEMKLKSANMTYAELNKKAEAQEEWL